MASARRVGGVKVAGSLAVAGAVGVALLASGPAVAGDGGTPCPRERIRTASGCTSLAAAGREIRAIVERSVRENDLRAALARVDLGDRSIARVSAGESMDGVPANLRMNFRIGSVAIPYVIDLLLQLQNDRRLSLDDRLSNWFPDLPDADRVTLRMLATATSGYADWVQEDPAWIKVWYANVFRQWQTRELLDIALARPRICDPGTCFHYAHTNFIILGNVIEAVTGKPVAELLAGASSARSACATPGSPHCPTSRHRFCTRTLPTAVPTRTRPSGARPGRSPRA